jgi:asparagine synthase (glutamine-hydrolysing)
MELNSLVKRAVRKVKRLGLPPVVRRVQRECLTYVSDSGLKDLYKRVRQVEKQGLPGILIETGCAAGGSAIVIARAKAKSRPFFVYDVFGMIPEPTERDGADVHARYQVIKSGKSTGIRDKKYYGYEDDLLGKVKEHFARLGVPAEANNVHFVKGLYEDVLKVDQPVALAHIDCDWYQSVHVCLKEIEPHLVVGGVLVIDDYAFGEAHGYSGCGTAVDEYFADKKERYEFVFGSKLHIVRRS